MNQNNQNVTPPTDDPWTTESDKKSNQLQVEVMSCVFALFYLMICTCACGFNKWLLAFTMICLLGAIISSTLLRSKRLTDFFVLILIVICILYPLVNYFFDIAGFLKF